MPPTIDERLRELAEATHEQFTPSPDLLGRIRASAGRHRQLRARPVPLLGLVAAVIVIVAAVGVVVTRPSAHHQHNTVPSAPPTTAAPATAQAVTPTTTAATTAAPLTAPRVAQMLAAGQFAAIASGIEPPSQRSADQAVLEQAWADLTTNAYGTLLSTETQDEDLFPPPGNTGAAGPGAVDETVLQMSHGLILLRVTHNPDGALVHVELQPLSGGPFSFDIGQLFGF
jgi:hypothetical protein